MPALKELQKKQGFAKSIGQGEADGGDDAVKPDGYYFFKDNEYHVTSLLGCPRKAILGRLCGDYAVPLNVWKMQLGTLGHELMERNHYKPGIAERLLSHRFYVKPDVALPVGKDGLTSVRCQVVGKFDWFDTVENVIHDYKFVWGTQYLPHEAHFRQVATYCIIGKKCGAFRPDQIKGGQIDYVDVTTGIMHPYAVSGKRFDGYCAEMETYLPKMLKHYVNAKGGIIPAGDKSRGECNYCSPEFKAHCAQGFKCDCRLPASSLSDAKTVKISIDAWRKANTPTEEDRVTA